MLSDCGSSMIMDALSKGLIDNVFLYFCISDEEGEVQVIEDAFELHASMRARPEMNYYYYY